MKKYLFLTSIIITCCLYPGFAQIHMKGFHVETSATSDFIQNFQGGLQKGHAYLGMENLIINLNIQELGGWKGGELLVHGIHTHGAEPSANFIGDLQVFSNIEAGNHIGLYEFTYLQQLGSFTFLIGQHDLNSEFVVTEEASLFLNSSFGILPTISFNVPVSIFPVAAPSVMVDYQLNPEMSFRGAVYDGDPGNIQSNKYNLNWQMNSQEGYFHIGELAWQTSGKADYEGRYILGSYYHSGDFPNYTTQEDSTDIFLSNYGAYITGDQEIISANGFYNNGINLFFQLGFAPAPRNLANYFVGLGINTRSIFPSQPNDQIGLAVAHMGLSHFARQYYNYRKRSETTIELTYLIYLGENYTIQPNLQYLINPGLNHDNALVGAIRFSLWY